MSTDEIQRAVADTVSKHVMLSVSDIDPTDDLRALGLTSLATIELLLELEAQFGLLFPDELLTNETFGTLGSLARAVEQLVEHDLPQPEVQD